MASCPKCGFDHPDQSVECLRCGVVFAKLGGTRAPAPLPSALQDNCIIEDDGRFGFWMRMPGRETGARQPVRWAVWGVLVLVSLWLLRTPGGERAHASLLHLVHAPFHNSGHVLFAGLGRRTACMCGTVIQLMAPVLFIIHYFFKESDAFMGAIGVWWFGEGLLDLAPHYARFDTGLQPLVAGQLTLSTPAGFLMADLLPRQITIGGALALFGWIVMLAGLVWGAALLIFLRTASGKRHGAP